MNDGGVINTLGLYGGQTSTTQVKLNITQDMNGVKINCQGTNEALQRSVNEAIELQVLCKRSTNMWLLLSVLLSLFFFSMMNFFFRNIILFITEEWGVMMTEMKMNSARCLLATGCCCVLLKMFLNYTKKNFINKKAADCSSHNTLCDVWEICANVILIRGLSFYAWQLRQSSHLHHRAQLSDMRANRSR